MSKAKHALRTNPYFSMLQSFLAVNDERDFSDAFLVKAEQVMDY